VVERGYEDPRLEWVLGRLRPADRTVVLAYGLDAARSDTSAKARVVGAFPGELLVVQRADEHGVLDGEPAADAVGC